MYVAKHTVPLWWHQMAFTWAANIGVNQIHHSDVIWASWCPKLLAVRLCVQQFVPAYMNPTSRLQFTLWGNPLVGGGFPSLRPSKAESFSMTWHRHIKCFCPNEKLCTLNQVNWMMLTWMQLIILHLWFKYWFSRKPMTNHLLTHIWVSIRHSTSLTPFPHSDITAKTYQGFYLSKRCTCNLVCNLMSLIVNLFM